MNRLQLILAILITFSPITLFATQPKVKDTPLAVQALNKGIETFEPENVFVWAEFPRETKIRSTAKLKIIIKNYRTAKAFHMKSLDIGRTISEGFRIKKIRPNINDMNMDFDEFELDYAAQIQPNKQYEITIELEAIKAGLYKGDIDIWEGNNFLTRVIQCKVTE